MNRYSIIQTHMDHCFVCGTKDNIHIHEVFFGTAHRQISIKEGLCVALCGKHHNLSKNGVHQDHELDLRLKQLFQAEWLSQHNNNLDAWFKLFRRSWI